MPQAGSDGRRSAGMTPLGTPTETGLHPGARPGSGFEHQQQITGNHPYSFLNRVPNTQASCGHCPDSHHRKQDVHGLGVSIGGSHLGKLVSSHMHGTRQPRSFFDHRVCRPLDTMCYRSLAGLPQGLQSPHSRSFSFDGRLNGGDRSSLQPGPQGQQVCSAA